MKNIIVIIPARGGSKGIPRKNLRLLNGKPLISYSIKNALGSIYNPDVYVTTEDDEIELLSKKFGAKIHQRPAKLADDKSTLDPVIYNTLLFAEKTESKKYDIVITMQATSPLLETRSIDGAIDKMLQNESLETIISAKDDTHLSWRKEENRYVPNYSERLNRQYLQPIYTETGGFLITKREVITNSNRIGENVDLFLLANGQEIDIDTYNDWNLCDYILQRKKILFVVAGNKKIGLGHVFNTLIIANDILDHEIEFLTPNDSDLAFEKIKSNNYNVQKQNNDNIIDDIEAIAPNIVINDILDTDSDYIIELKKRNIKCINFEDLGKGAAHADLVINAIYPEKKKIDNHFYGEKYFILRDEFIFNHSKKVIKDRVSNILITFGGVDPDNLTELTLSFVYDYCCENNININVVAGSGYKKYNTLEKFSNISIHKDVKNISEFMYEADLIFTSAGRTVYEIASIGTPAIVLAQNKRELSHFFAFEKFGFINLGLGKEVSKSGFLDVFLDLVKNRNKRVDYSNLMLEQNLKLGRKRVQKLIKELIKSY